MQVHLLERGCMGNLHSKNRRQFISHSLGGVGILSLGSSLLGMTSSKPFVSSQLDKLASLNKPDELGVQLPEGYQIRIVAESGKPVPLTRGEKSKYVWHGAPDGGACFKANDGGWVYVSNSELSANAGGVGAIRFDSKGEAVDAYPILSRTTRNCAGGPTPWNTWLSCEEVPSGAVYECDPFNGASAVKRPALGFFQHEAAAIDPRKGHIYLTEDEPDGCLYRYTPATISKNGVMDLEKGELEVAKVKGDQVTWHPLLNPNPSLFQKSTRYQVSGAARFNGGEGIWYFRGLVFFTTKGDNRVWAYRTDDSTLAIIYDPKTAQQPILSGVDNITVSNSGQILVGEDGGDMQIVVLALDGTTRPLVQLNGQDFSEITGPAINWREDRLYFSSQRGPVRGAKGITYEILGNFS